LAGNRNADPNRLPESPLDAVSRNRPLDLAAGRHSHLEATPRPHQPKANQGGTAIGGSTAQNSLEVSLTSESKALFHTRSARLAGREDVAALATPVPNDALATRRRHAPQEPVNAPAIALFRLVGTFDRTNLACKVTTRGRTPAAACSIPNAIRGTFSGAPQIGPSDGPGSANLGCRASSVSGSQQRPAPRPSPIQTNQRRCVSLVSSFRSERRRSRGASLRRRGSALFHNASTGGARRAVQVPNLRRGSPHRSVRWNRAAGRQETGEETKRSYPPIVPQWRPVRGPFSDPSVHIFPQSLPRPP